MLERFDRSARGAVVQARTEARIAGQNQMTSAHLLIGLLAHPGQAADALAAAGLSQAGLRAHIPHSPAEQGDELDGEALALVGIDLDAVRRATDAAFGPGALDHTRKGRSGRITADQDFKRSLELSLYAARSMDQDAISSGHVLLGILDHQRGAGVGVLTSASVDVAALRADVVRRLSAAA
jgi:ATP-dependent Clp protease ATP-binding subunit ClpA